MKSQTICTLMGIVSMVALSACGPGRSAPTPDTQATVNAAVAATSTAQASLKATVDAAVQATTAAIPTLAPTAGSQATLASAPTAAPTPAPVSYVTVSEEELAALIDQAAAQAVASTQASSTATTSATADGQISQQEAAALVIYAANADQAIAYAEELINAYYGLYADLATETLAVLKALEQDLATMSDSVAALNATLQEVNKALAQGLTLAEQTIAKLNTAAQTASDKAAQAQAKAQAWAKSLPADRDRRATAALGVKPAQVASDRQGAILSAFDYVDAVRQAMGDNKITQAEITGIAQLGANASASLKAQGGPALQPISGSIDKLTSQLARGQVPQAKAGLGNLETSLGARPARPRP